MGWAGTETSAHQVGMEVPEESGGEVRGRHTLSVAIGAGLELVEAV